MKKLVFVIALFASSFTPLQGGTDPVAQQLLIAAEQQARLFHDEPGSFQLEVDFTAQLNVPVRGHETVKWVAKDRWWSKVVMGGFEQVTVKDGEKLFTSRNISFTPVRIRELTSLLHFASEPNDMVTKKMKQRVENGLAITCIQVQLEKNHGELHEICMDATSHDILSDEWSEPPDEKRKEQFADYVGFGGHRFPQSLQLRVNGIPAVSAKVISLTEARFDDSLLVPPKGAIERRECPDIQRAVPIKTPEPIYPRSAGQNGLMGDTTVAMTILTDGSVSDLQVIGRAANTMDEASLQTIKKWKFKPAMCGSDPVVSDIEVVVSFRIN